MRTTRVLMRDSLEDVRLEVESQTSRLGWTWWERGRGLREEDGVRLWVEGVHKSSQEE